jgi:hypothetical protein
MRLKPIVYAAAAVIAIASTSTAQSPGVVITEIHRDPAAGGKTAIPGGYSHSFVEIANFGGDTFFFKDVFLTNGKAVDSIRLFDAPVVGHASCRFGDACLPPGGIAVVLPQNYAVRVADSVLAALSPVHPIADGTVLLTVNRKNLCGGLANDDGIALYRGTRSQIDSLISLAADPGVYVSAPLSGKIPLSLKQPKGVSVVPASIVLGNRSGNRRYILSPTVPLTPGRYEALLDGMLIEYSADMFFGTVQCSLAVVFVTENGQNATWRFYSNSSSGAAAEEIGRGVFGDRRQYLPAIDIDPKPGNYVFEITTGGGRTVCVPIDLSGFWAAAGSLRVTEIYPRGSAKAGQPEWFELQNVSTAGVNLNEWMFGNPSDTAVLAASDLILPSGQFIVVTKDTAAMRGKYPNIPMMIKPSRWIALNNNNDTICVLSPRGVTADMAVYRSAWFGRGGWTTQSLERVSGAGNGRDSVSWTLCHTPTPGFPGSAGAWRAVSAPSMEIGPTPFKPNGKKVDSFLSIRLKAPPNYRIKVKILSFDGKLLKTFTDEKEVIMWDGKTEKSRPAPPGPIYVIAEFTSTGGKKVTVRKNSILWR